MINRNVVFLCLSGLILAGLFNFGCGAAKTNSSNTPLTPLNQNAVNPESKPSDQAIEPAPFLQNTPDGLKTAWQRFIETGRYRMARLNEFSESAKKHIGRNYEGIHLPLLFDINQDGGFDDVAVIVVDTKRDDGRRFGLVVFSAPKVRPGAYLPTWVFRERDLSRTVLSRASARLVLSEYRDDASQVSCSVKWSQKRQMYNCEQ